MQGPELDIQATEEGILISLTDRQNFSMFAIGSAEPQPRVVKMMEAIAASLRSFRGPIIVRGHTDARPYRSATYDNWRLSSARAQMAYYMLIYDLPSGCSKTWRLRVQNSLPLTWVGKIRLRYRRFFQRRYRQRNDDTRNMFSTPLPVPFYARRRV